jgi:hypothetical protein
MYFKCTLSFLYLDYICVRTFHLSHECKIPSRVHCPSFLHHWITTCTATRKTLSLKLYQLSNWCYYHCSPILVHCLPACLPAYLSIYLSIYLCCSHLEYRASVKHLFHLFLNLRQSVGPLGRGISPS